MRIQYSDRRKAEALAVLDANGGNVEQTARLTGICPTNLKRWRDGVAVCEDVVLLRTEKREGLRIELWRLAWQALGVTQEKLSECSAKEAAAIMGIAIDKMSALDMAGAKEGELFHEQVQPVIQDLKGLMIRFIPLDRKERFLEEYTRLFERVAAQEGEMMASPRRPEDFDGYAAAECDGPTPF